MNTKKILIIASIALVSVAAGYGLIGLRPAGAGGGSGTDSGPLLGVDDGASRVVFLDETRSYLDRDDDARWDEDDDDRYEDGERQYDDDRYGDDDHEDREHDDD